MDRIEDLIKFAQNNGIDERPFNYVVDEYYFTKETAEAYEQAMSEEQDNPE